MTDKGDPPRPSGSETRDALADVLKDQAARSERYAASEKPKERSPVPARIATVIMIPLTIWVWLSPPALLRPAPIEPPPRVVEAGSSMELYVAAIQINDYRAANGRLPATLTEALEEGDDAGDVVYEILDATRYRLSVTRGPITRTYESTDDVSSLARQARPVLGGNE